MLKVWGRRNSINVQKAMWAIGEADVEHEHIDAGGQFGGLNTDEFRAIESQRAVPVIDDDGTVVWESPLDRSLHCCAATVEAAVAGRPGNAVPR